MYQSTFYSNNVRILESLIVNMIALLYVFFVNCNAQMSLATE